MNDLLDVAANFSTPLALGGFATLLLLLSLRQLGMALNWFSDRPLVQRIFEKISLAMIILAAIAVIAGFTGYVLVRATPDSTDKPLNARLITLQVSNRSLRQILHDCAAQIKAVLAVDSRVEPLLSETMTIDVRNAELKDVMNAICEANGCKWDIVNGDPPVLLVAMEE